MLKHQVAAVVVLYQPDKDVIERVNSYVDDVGAVFAIDNSDNVNPEVADALRVSKKVKYVSNNGNRGIAHALNEGTRRAIHAGYEWLLTMDQDSQFKPGAINKMFDCIAKVGGSEKLGIVSPFHSHELVDEPETDETTYPMFVMTSGNLLNISAYEQAGPFKNEYFIDRVDHEYCLRLTASGFRIALVNAARLMHQVGNATRRELFFLSATPTNHSALRRYYYVRNYFYMRSEYRKSFPDYFASEDWVLFKEISKVACYSEEQRIKKLMMMWKGFQHYRKGVYGPFPQGQTE